MSLLNKFLRAGENKNLKKLENTANQIDALSEDFEEISDAELKAKTDEFKQRLADGETLDELSVEAFATVREASRRVLGMYPFKVQLMGGLALQNGDIAEQKTGEGKAHDINTRIPTPKGWKKAGDIKVGDYIFDRKGNPTEVVGVYPQGVKQVYEITLKDGRKVRCNEEHLWSVYIGYTKKEWETLTTAKILEVGARNKNDDGDRDYNFYLPMNHAVEYSEKDLKIPPYVMGKNLENNNCIPEVYKISSIEQRKELINEIFDNNKYCSNSIKIIKDVLEIIFSLGFSANINQTGKVYEIEIVKTDRIAITDIKKLDEEVEQVCFAVDNPEHLFLVGDYVVTHNTLVATMPAYLRALTGDGVHIVTVNDYLAKYQSEMMGRVYNFLGLSVGCILNNQTPAERKEAYNADITYGTNNEFGFDYLRDNMAQRPEDMVQRGHNYVIIDEIDSILIDEARTPLIISGAADGDFNALYKKFSQIVKTLVKDTDYEVNEEKKTISITESGIDKVEKALNIDSLYEAKNTSLIGLLNNAIKAKELFKKDKDYIIENGEVLIVDEHTGRVLAGRRYSDGIHQAIESKENVKIQEENQTLATITLQNYFRLYPEGSRAGMTGTAETEAAEFNNIYKMNVVAIPTNNEMIRKDRADLVFPSLKGKLNAIIEDIGEKHSKGQPILVGTASVESSEVISKLLKKAKIPHNVLNAKNHAQEAKIIAMAGRKGAVTVATNMAGRGTDIMLGGNAEFIAQDNLKKRGLDPKENPDEYSKEWAKALDEARLAVKNEHDEVVDLGGLYVLGTERHESRRIDNQLRGRSGRQGDPGESRFYISMEDDLMRLFNSGIATKILQSGLYPEDMPLESKSLTKSIATAQSKIESRNQEIRKNILKYDDVMNNQRTIIYDERKNVMESDDLSENIDFFLEDFIENMVNEYTVMGLSDNWDLDGLWMNLKEFYPVSITIEDLENEYGSRAALTEEILNLELIGDIKTVYKTLEEDLNENPVAIQQLGENPVRELERRVLLDVVDRAWREHLYEVDYLKEGIGLRGMGQKDPLVEYKTETAEMFNALLNRIRKNSVQLLFAYSRQFKKMYDEQIKIENEIKAKKLTANVMGDVGQKDINKITRVSNRKNAKNSNRNNNVGQNTQEFVGNRAQRRAAQRQQRRKG